MEGVTLRKKGLQILALEVPGLAEKRPSLVHGDGVFVKAVSRTINEDTYRGLYLATLLYSSHKFFAQQFLHSY